MKKTIETKLIEAFENSAEVYHIHEVGALSVGDMKEALEAMNGPSKHGDLRWALSYEQMIKLAVPSNPIFDQLFLGIPIIMSSEFSDTNIYLVDIKDYSHAILSGVTCS